MALTETLLLPVVETAKAHQITAVILVPLVLLLLRYSYRLSPLHPLSHVPGPWKAAWSSTYLNYHAYIGDEATAVHDLHETYGPIVRTGHNSVDIADGAALQPVYAERGGFLKPAFYGNFDIDGHQSIFSATDPAHRAPRAKAVFGIFSTSNLRAGSSIIGAAVDGFVDRFKREKSCVQSDNVGSKQVIDVIGICRALAIDVVTSYLFGLGYGACEEDLPSNNDTKVLNMIDQDDRMTASGMVDAFVAVGRIWYLPPRTFQLLDSFTTWLWPSQSIDQSMNLVDNFVARAVSKTIDDKTHSTYPGRLLQAGFTESEVRAQCKDVIFAGTDSTGMNLATICFYLAKSEQTYAALKREIQKSNPSDTDLQSLPYLRGVVKEGLRLAMANPSRLARVVPSTGWTFESTYFPAGTIVSCTPFELHFNPSVFPEPTQFKPERWLPENNPTDRMNRDYIPFGLGSRQCIARNLATLELFYAVKRIAEEDLLAGLTNVKDSIEIAQWFNSHVLGGIELKCKA